MKVGDAIIFDPESWRERSQSIERVCAVTECGRGVIRLGRHWHTENKPGSWFVVGKFVEQERKRIWPLGPVKELAFVVNEGKLEHSDRRLK